MKDDYTQIAVVLDRSGSMTDCEDATREGYNKFLSDQQAAPGRADLLLVQFDHEYQVSYDGPVGKAWLLDKSNYVPRGSTALLDAIGRTITDLGCKLAGMNEADRPGKVIIAILTDGKENASTDFKRQRVSEMIAVQRDVYKWEIIFLGAGLDAINEAHNLGISITKTMQYGKVGTRNTFASASANVMSYRSTGDTHATDWTNTQRLNAMVPDESEKEEKS